MRIQYTNFNNKDYLKLLNNSGEAKTELIIDLLEHLQFASTHSFQHSYILTVIKRF